MAMIELTGPKALTQLRRVALDAQGLIKAQPYGRGIEGARQAINHLGYVQIDTISVVERAHHHVLNTRVPNYSPEMLNDILINRDVFEYWSHAAAFLPMADFRYSLPYKNAIKGGQTHWYKTPDQKLMGELLTRIRVDGPLRSRDLETDSKKRSGWWDLKPAKKALEQLYMQGDLMVCDRTGFQKTYDLTERVLPKHVNIQVPTIEEFASYMVSQQLRCHGLVTLKGVTYLRRNTPLRNAVKSFVSDGLQQGRLQEVKVPSGEVFVLETGALDQPLSRMSNRLTILSPFDNSVIQRDRLKSLFQYDYQIECYVPAAKRQYGYFCLPLLFKGEFIGRMDCKAHRKDRHLEIKALYFESYNFDDDALVAAFVKAIKQFCLFQKCESLSLIKTYPKHMERNLKQALRLDL